MNPAYHHRRQDTAMTEPEVGWQAARTPFGPMNIRMDTGMTDHLAAAKGSLSQWLRMTADANETSQRTLELAAVLQAIIEAVESVAALDGGDPTSTESPTKPKVDYPPIYLPNDMELMAARGAIVSTIYSIANGHLEPHTEVLNTIVKAVVLSLRWRPADMGKQGCDQQFSSISITTEPT